MPSEQEAMVEFLKWASAGLLGVVGALVVYIWLDHRGREKEDKDGIKTALTVAITKMEEKLERAVAAMECAVSTLGKSIGDKIDVMETRLDDRIDEMETRQTKHETDLATERQRTNGVIAVCRERARHCPMFAVGEGSAHFHRRMGEQGDRCHQRCAEELTQDGSEGG